MRTQKLVAALSIAGAMSLASYEPVQAAPITPLSAAAKPAAEDGSSAIQVRWGYGWRGGGWRCGADEAAAGQLITAAMATGQGGAEITDGQWAPTLTCDNEPPLVAHALRASFDASEDGTGRGVPLVPLQFDTTQLTSPGCRANPKPGDICHTIAAGMHAPSIAFVWQDNDLGRSLRMEGAPTLRLGGQVAVAQPTCWIQTFWMPSMSPARSPSETITFTFLKDASSPSPAR